MREPAKTIVIASVCSLVLGFMGCWGYMAFQEASLHTYAALLEGENRQLKMDSIQKDLDYLNREQCQHIMMRVMNFNNEVKDVEFVSEGLSHENQRYVTIIVDGKQKNYDYDAIISKTFSVECADDFKW